MRLNLFSSLLFLSFFLSFFPLLFFYIHSTLIAEPNFLQASSFDQPNPFLSTDSRPKRSEGTDVGRSSREKEGEREGGRERERERERERLVLDSIDDSVANR